MTNYEKIRSEVSKHFKNEIESLKLEIIRLRNENTELQVENLNLKMDVQKYKSRLNALSGSKKSLLGMTEAIKQLI